MVLRVFRPDDPKARNMEERRKLIEAFSECIQGYFIWLLIGCYILAAVWPGPGLAIREYSFGELVLFGES
jgi:hypothetical protein